MKASIIVAMMALSLCITAIADEAKPSVYVAAFAHSETSARPGSFTFTEKDGKTFLNVIFDDLNVTMPVVVRQSATSEDPEHKVFDAVYIAKDRLSSVVVTGRLSKNFGSGKLALHFSANGSRVVGGFDLHSFSLAPLQAKTTR